MSNTITVVGNLTREPELKYISSGRATCNLGIASSRRYMQNGEWTEQTSFFNLTVWADQAENVAATFSKGDRVIAHGRLEARPWETKEGEKRTSYEIIVDEIGPSLRWARGTIERVKRDNDSGPMSAPPASPNRAPDPIYGEEPF